MRIDIPWISKFVRQQEQFNFAQQEALWFYNIDLNVRILVM